MERVARLQSLLLKSPVDGAPAPHRGAPTKSDARPLSPPPSDTRLEETCSFTKLPGGPLT